MKILLGWMIVLVILYIIAVEMGWIRAYARALHTHPREKMESNPHAGIVHVASPDPKKTSTDRALAGPESLVTAGYIGMSGVGKQTGATGSETPGADDDFNEVPPAHADLDPEYLSSRERMGACGTLSRSRRNFGGEPDTRLLGTRNDDLFDGQRAVHMRTGCNNYKPRTAIAAIYGPAQAMGMHTVAGDAPSRESCTWLGEQGYMYEQSCMLDL